MHSRRRRTDACNAAAVLIPSSRRVSSASLCLSLYSLSLYSPSFLSPFSGYISPVHVHSLLFLVPGHHLVKTHALAAKNVQGTSNRQIYFSPTEVLDQLQIGNGATAAGVGDGDAAPLAQLGDELVVDAALQAFDVGGVDEELGAVGFEEVDALCSMRF